MHQDKPHDLSFVFSGNLVFGVLEISIAIFDVMWNSGFEHQLFEGFSRDSGYDCQAQGFVCNIERNSTLQHLNTHS